MIVPIILRQVSRWSIHSTAVLLLQGCSVSLSVYILANNALRAHHASVHGGLSANGLSDICLSFFEMILLSFLK